jgi:hypothetical protein
MGNKPNVIDGRSDLLDKRRFRGDTLFIKAVGAPKLHLFGEK